MAIRTKKHLKYLFMLLGKIFAKTNSQNKATPTQNTTQQKKKKKKKIHELFGHVALFSLRIPGPSLRRCEHFVPTQTHQTTSESIIAIVAKNKSWRRKEIVFVDEDDDDDDDDESRRRTRFFHQRNLGVDRR